eukprot:TRINITY_DN4660_c0_g2_i4.p1 TRINITY_DN4660_c0_g2~~TRINITY_DN4660_c0_g2_i4.p1  ORF type:complete len:452 (+),score=93.86 TRINITY_DN4660_c0_g2_i4:852-2207(+)
MKRLVLTGTPSEPVAGMLVCCSSLVNLELHQGDLQPAVLLQMARHPTLCSVSLHGCCVPANCSIGTAEFPAALREIELIEVGSVLELVVVSGPLRVLKVQSCPQLKMLDLKGQREAAVECTVTVSDCTELTEIRGRGGNRTLAVSGLAIDSCPQIPVDDLFLTTTTLKSLQLGMLAQLSHFKLPDLPNLRSLSLDNLLRTLQIEFSANLPDLGKLEMFDLPLLQHVSAAVASFPRLESIELTECPRLSDEALMCLIHAAPNLQTLFLSGCGWIGRVASSTIQHLTSLKLRSCDGLDRLDCTHPELSRLDVDWCTKLSFLIIDAPNLALLHVDGRGCRLKELSLVACELEAASLLNIDACSHLVRVDAPRVREWAIHGCGFSTEHISQFVGGSLQPVSYTHLRAHETPEHLVCRLLLEKKKKKKSLSVATFPIKHKTRPPREEKKIKRDRKN